MESGSLVLCLASALAVVLQTGADPTGEPCPPVEGELSCVCNHPDGKIDLTALSNTDGKARFTNIIDPNNLVYSYNPCSTFTDTEACTNVYICQSINTDKYPIVDKGTEKIYIDNDDIYVYYSSPIDGYLREAMVHLKCNLNRTTGNEVLTTDGDSKITLLYEFTLSSCHACPGGCSGGSGPVDPNHQ